MIGKNNRTIRTWELWWAKVQFEESSETKRRPVLIVDEDELWVFAFKVTSREPRNEWGEYEVIKWQSSGLDKPSTVRLSRRIALTDRDLESKIGDLHPIDIQRISKMLDD